MEISERLCQELRNIFYKNKPVLLVEHTRAGNGNIPAIPTAFGIISPSICYDADFPSDMRQLGEKRAALLLLPANDWYAISPYHSYMAIFRGIENGCSVFRQTDEGLSLATDYRGKTLAGQDFFEPCTKLWFASVPIHHVNTVYAVIGDGFVYLCMAIVFLIMLCYSSKN